MKKISFALFLHKLLVFITLCVFLPSLTGCSLIPRITFDTPNTIPQATDKSSIKHKCSGKIEYYEDGTVKYCSKGYYNYTKNYVKKERKMTWVESIKSWFNTILGWGIPGLIILCLIFPGLFTLFGTLIGRAIEGAFGGAITALKRVVKAVQNTRKTGINLDQSLESELDKKDKDYIANLKKKENIK